jgi:hypothetical protein
MEKKTKIQALTNELKKFEGLDADQIRALLKEADDRKTQELEAKGQWDAVKKQMSDAHAKELDAKAKELKDALDGMSGLKAQIGELTVGTSFAQSKYIAEKLEYPISKVRALFGAHFEFTDGAVVGYDKPAGAKGRVPLVDSKGEPLSFDEALSKLVDADPDRDSLLKSTLRPGAGSSTEKGKVKETPVVGSGLSRIQAALANPPKK